jgi:threonine dehydrogenase-like Zn-dependent dehydrogenase
VITGACEYTPDDYARSIGLLASGELPIDLLVETDDVPLASLQQAMERLRAGEVSAKVVVAPHLS